MATAFTSSPIFFSYCSSSASVNRISLINSSKLHAYPLSHSKTSTTSSSTPYSLSLTRKHPRKSFQVRSVAAPVEVTAGFDEMVSGTQRKYYLLGGKGGVGKTSCAASLAVKFANNGHPTLVVSTDPAHSLSDSFAQDLTGGTLVEGPLAPLLALEIKLRNNFAMRAKKMGVLE